MFSNFIYFITAILLFGAYGQIDQTTKPDLEMAVFSLFLVILFFVSEFFLFVRLMKKTAGMDHGKADMLFTRASGLFSIAVLMIHASFIYLINISQYLPDFLNSGKTEALRNLSILIFFTSLMLIHWAVSYPCYRKIYEDHDGIAKYLKSQLMFSVPVIVPWLFMLVLTDILEALPFDGFKAWLGTTSGEMCLLVFLIAGMSFLAPFLVKAAWGCKPLPGGSSLEIIRQICEKTGIRFTKILEWPLKGGNAITAGVMGVFGRFRYLLVTPALLRSMSDDELGAVIAHEAGHVKYRHMLLYIVVLGSFSFASIIAAQPLEELLVFSGFFTALSDQTGIEGRSFSFLPGLFSVIFFITFIRFVFGFFMRNFERQADSFSMKIMGSPLPLVKAFHKIVWLTRQDPEKPSWHHYSIKERIDFILKCEEDKNATKEHDKKVFISLAFYMSLLFAVMLSANFYENSSMRDDLFRKFLTEAGKGELKTHEMDRIMADSYYLKGNMEKSIFFYEQADSKNPDDPETLNSLAWIYATTDKSKIKNPEKAVNLAKRALFLKPDSPHIMDTYAESLYAAADFSGALNYGQKALSLADEKDREYYERQVEKFRKKAEETNQ